MPVMLEVYFVLMGIVFSVMLLILAIWALGTWIKGIVHRYRERKYDNCPLNGGYPCDAGGKRIHDGTVMCCLYCERFQEEVDRVEKYRRENGESNWKYRRNS